MRVTSIERGLIDLEVEETFPGAHTIAKHVGRTIEQLKARLAAEPRRPAASTFRTLDDAEAGVSEVIRAHAKQIEEWAVSANIGDRASFTLKDTSISGIVVERSGRVRESSEVIIVLSKIVEENRLYYVFTSYCL